MDIGRIEVDDVVILAQHYEALIDTLREVDVRDPRNAKIAPMVRLLARGTDGRHVQSALRDLASVLVTERRLFSNA